MQHTIKSGCIFCCFRECCKRRLLVHCQQKHAVAKIKPPSLREKLPPCVSLGCWICCALLWNVPHTLMCLATRFPTGGDVWEGLEPLRGADLLEELGHCEHRSWFYSPIFFLFILFASWLQMQWDQLASRSCNFIFSTNVECIPSNPKARIKPSLLKLLRARYFVTVTRTVNNADV